MKAILRGTIVDYVPAFNGDVDESGALVLHASGKMPFTVDTGFSGGIAVPSDLLGRMDVKLIDFDVFRLATGISVELPIYWGSVRIGDRSFGTWMIPGDSLVGMELLTLAGSELRLDLIGASVVLLA